MATAPTKPIVPPTKFSPAVTAGNVVKAMTAASAKGGKGEPFNAPISAIRVMDDFNVRVTGTPASEEAMGELVQSILANGFYQHKPLAVFVAADADADVLYVKDGHRRFEAVQRANARIAEINANKEEGSDDIPLIETLPVIASPAGSIEDMMIEVAQSNTGAPLTMFEKGLLAQRLIDADMTKDDIAARLSMTERHLNNVLLLAKAPAKLRNLIVSDKITPTVGLRLMRDPKTAAEKAQEMVKASEAKGKAKAQPKDSGVNSGGKPVGPKMAKSEREFNFGQGDSIKTMLQNIAAYLRENVTHGEDDAISLDAGKVVINLSLPAPEPEAAPAPEPEAAPAPEKPAKKPAAAKKAAAPKKPARAAKPAADTPAEAPAGENLDGL